MSSCYAPYGLSRTPAVSGFPAPRRYAIIRGRRGAKAPGPGRYRALQCSGGVAGTVAGKNAAKSSRYYHPLRRYTCFAPSHMCARACAPACSTSSFHCSTVADIYYLIDKTGKKAATVPATPPLHHGLTVAGCMAVEAVSCLTLWNCSKRGEFADVRA